MDHSACCRDKYPNQRGNILAMLRKILWADIRKKKTITLILFFFVMMAAFLVATSTSMIASLTQSLAYFLDKASAPHYVQMSEGPLNEQLINDWSSKNSTVKNTQIVKMILFNPEKIYLNQQNSSEKNSVMNFDFVTQNNKFDFLLNLKGEIIHPKQGEIAVPIYFMQQNHLKIGDKISIQGKSYHREFKIIGFTRDAQMNPSIIHSKRFVIHPLDFNMLMQSADKIVYLIEFQLKSLSDISKFSGQYQLSDLPKNGPSIDYNLYKVLNSVTDGISIGVILLVSILLTLIAILCLRFTILTTLEEDYKQIGIMQAIGIAQKTIKKLYLAKYALIASLACGIGYIVALGLRAYFVANILLYLGTAPRNVAQYTIPLIGVACIWLLVLLACRLVIRRFNKITAVDALRSGIVGNTKINRRVLKLGKNRFLNVNFFMGISEIFQNVRTFILLFFVFIVSSVIVILPINFLNTLKLPSFVTYMGVSQSDLRIDLRQTGMTSQNFDKIIAYLKHDPEVKSYLPIVTARFSLVNEKGGLENINIDIGDSTILPIEYLKGSAPSNEHQISISYLNSKQFNKTLGDKIYLYINGQNRQMTISGIYQDITNGGKTAKALLPYDPNSVMWYVINVDLKPHASLSNKKNLYTKIFSPARVTYLTDYVAQTMGGLIHQIQIISFISIAIAILLSVLITSMFLKMLVVKNYSQIAIMKAIGFSLLDIRIQYFAKILFILWMGILFGTYFSNTIGQSLVGLMWSFMGASEIHFIINPLQVYFYCPILLMTVVALSTLLSIGLIKKIHIMKMIVE